MAAPIEDAIMDSTTDPHSDSVEDLRAQLATLEQEIEAFRVLARDRAIKGFQDGEWGLDSLNDTLERLGLDRYEPNYVSRSDATLEFQVEVDDSDNYRADTTLQQLQHDEVREALTQAVASVLNEHAVTVTDAYFRVYTGYASRVMV